MNGKTKRLIWVALLLVITAAAATGYYLFNKGPVDVKNSSGIKTNASDMYSLFITDSTQAQKKFIDKIVAVSGTANEITTTGDNLQVITIKTNTDGGFINCTMEENVSTIKAGDPVNIKGICSGIGQGEPDLGIKGDVYLSRCFLVP